jgi:hypothetical protein
MRTSVALLAALLALSFAPSLVGQAHAQDKTSEAKPKATKATVVARKQRLEKARDGVRALASTPPPAGLTAAQKKVFEEEMTNLRAVADGTDAVIQKLDAGLAKPKVDLDSMSEMGETESLRLQMAMDRLSKVMSTLSNLLKKVSDTASTITQNLK